MFLRDGEDFEAWRARVDNCDFRFDDHDELSEFFEELSGRMRDALSPYNSQWREPPTIGTRSWQAFIALRSWLDKALAFLIPAAAQNAVAVEPFRYFRRLIHGELDRNSDRCREVVDATADLHLKLLGSEGHYIFVWDRETETIEEVTGRTAALAVRAVDELLERQGPLPSATTLLVGGSESSERPTINPDQPPAETIPAEFLTRVMSKAQAAVKRNCPAKHKNKSQYIDREVEQGRMKRPIGSGQSWQFDIRDFPPERQAEVARITPNPNTL